MICKHCSSAECAVIWLVFPVWSALDMLLNPILSITWGIGPASTRYRASAGSTAMAKEMLVLLSLSIYGPLVGVKWAWYEAGESVQFYVPSH